MTDIHTHAATAPRTIDAETQILYVQPVRCTGCGSLHTTARLFDVRPYARDGRSQRPALARAPHLEFQRIQCNTISTPICQDCPDSAVQPITDRESYARWQETLKRKREQERANTVKVASPASGPKRKETTLEDLI